MSEQPMTYTTRYTRYANAHGETPDAMSARDRERFPGGRMAGFIVWHSEQLRAFLAAHPACGRRGTLLPDAHDTFDAWLGSGATP